MAFLQSGPSSTGICRGRETERNRRKTLGARTRTDNKLKPHITPGPGIEHSLHCGEASTLATAPPLLCATKTPMHLLVQTAHWICL